MVWPVTLARMQTGVALTLLLRDAQEGFVHSCHWVVRQLPCQDKGQVLLAGHHDLHRSEPTIPECLTATGASTLLLDLVGESACSGMPTAQSACPCLGLQVTGLLLELPTCQTKVKGAGESFMDGRKRDMWNVGRFCVMRLTLPSSMTGSSGSYCSSERGSLTRQTDAGKAQQL